MDQQPGTQDSLVLSYLDMRKIVGFIGVALPFALAIGAGQGLQRTISNYYYTDMRNLFVGSLCAMGVFLISTKGYDRRDRIAGALSGIFAFVVALLPTSPDKPTLRQCVIGTLHLTSAALLFLTFAYFSLTLFTKTDQAQPTPQKRQRNRVYRVCGSLILVAILLIAIVKLANVPPGIARLEPIFWLESLAVEAFGVAWLTKGETILEDQVV